MNKVGLTQALIVEACETGDEDKLVLVKENGRDEAVSNGLTVDDLSMLIDRFVVPGSKENPSHSAVMESFTIIANALLLNKRLLTQFDPHRITTKVISECFQPNLVKKDEFLLMRLLFLLTFTGRPFEEKTLKTCLTIIATRVSVILANDCQSLDDTLERMTFIECMKLTFNLLHHYPSSIQHILYTAQDLVIIYYTLEPKRSNLDIYQYISNVLLCIPVDMWLYQLEGDAALTLSRILDFVEVMTCPQNDQLRQDHVLAPILSLIHCIVVDLKKPVVEEVDEEEPAKHHHLHIHRRSSSQPRSVFIKPDKEALTAVLTSRLLPSEKDREQVLGESDSLCSYLLQITIDPVLRTTRNIIFDVFWKLSDESPDEFVSNFGLGFASSFLASHGIAFPESVSTDAPTKEQLHARLAETRQPVNPITGQFTRYEEPVVDDQDEMTEEEKLRDAERLFVLFERLKANNVIHVENPVAVAARNGQL